MNAYYDYLNRLVNDHKQEYRDWPGLKWLNTYEAEKHQQQRDKLLLPFQQDALFKGTKPYYNHLSKGCELCGQGLWSCLFITGKCNANCFYCPAPQTHDEVPTSQGLTFETPEAYAEYINFFGFKGVSFSGGEPLLFPERVLAYLKALRKHSNPDLYIWMYTNGIKASEALFDQLAEAGLDEVRFDIGATNYNLDAVAKASGRVPHVTVEIPAVPEEKKRLMDLLPELINSGVTRLNLHQMRLTPYNVKKLSKHDYTYITAERPIVLESELAALEIMNYASDKQLDLGINYCSFYFKFRFQKAGYRKQIAKKLADRKATITESGYLKTSADNKLSYQGILLSDASKLNAPARHLVLEHKNYNVLLANAFATKVKNIPDFSQKCKTSCATPEKEPAFSVWKHEVIESGLREY